jgi:predicted dehydrogenase
VTALVNFFGPAKSVAAITAKGSEYRTYGAEVGETYKDTYKPFDRYPVNVTTHLTGVIEFQSGVLATVIASFEAYANTHPRIEIYGDQGTMTVPDPNTFGGPVKLMRAGQKEYQEIPLVFNYKDNSRALGLADMAKAIQTGRPWRANCMQQLHLVEVMNAFMKSSDSGDFVKIESPYTKSEPMKYTPLAGYLD